MTEPEPTAEIPLLAFGEAEALGHECFDRCVAMGFVPPLLREDLGWADIVQFVLRRASEIARDRGAGPAADYLKSKQSGRL